MKLLFALLLLALPASGEEIRIEIARGVSSLRVGSRVLTSRDVPAHFDGPLKVDGRDLPGKLEVFAERGTLVAVNELDLEDYVAAVVGSEVPPSWPADALKAQAVAARTFAVAQKVAQGAGARAHLGASVLDQVYKGTAHPAASALKAARETAGEVLTFGAAPIAAYFSASCGGVSENADAAFHVSVPYLHAGDADEDERSWTVRISQRDLSAALRDRLGADVRGMSIASRSKSGRANSMHVSTDKGTRALPAVELRQLLGYQKLPSLLFEVSQDGNDVVFKGKGSGHGVGLCQYGARSRAMRGDGYREILAHYYPGAEIRRMY